MGTESTEILAIAFDDAPLPAIPSHLIYFSQVVIPVYSWFSQVKRRELGASWIATSRWHTTTKLLLIVAVDTIDCI